MNLRTHENDSKPVSLTVPRNLTKHFGHPAHSQQSIAHNPIVPVMTHSKSTKDRKHLVEKFLNHTLHAHSPQAHKFWHFVSRKVFHSYWSAPAEVIIVLRTVTSVVRNFPPMAEPDSARWRHERTGAREEDTSSVTDVEPERVELFDGTQDNPWRVLEFHRITHADAIIQHPTDVLKNFRR